MKPYRKKTHGIITIIINLEPFIDHCCGGLIEDETTPQDRREVNKKNCLLVRT